MKIVRENRGKKPSQKIIRKTGPVLIVLLIVGLFGACGGSSERGGAEVKSFILQTMEINRKRVNGLLEKIEKTGQAEKILAWRPASGRAPIGWQIMHICATEDIFLNKNFLKQKTLNPAYSEAYASGKPAGDKVPTLAEIRKYMDATRKPLKTFIENFDYSKMDTKPPGEENWTFRRSLQSVITHEPHHQGQAHITFNIYKAAHGIK